MNALGQGLLTIVMAIIGLAILSVILSKQANTKSVIDSAGSFLQGSISAATGPVTGYGTGTNVGSQIYGYGQ